MLSLTDMLLLVPIRVLSGNRLGHRSVTVASMPFLTSHSSRANSREVCITIILGLKNRPGMLKLYAYLCGQCQPDWLKLVVLEQF